MRVLNCGEHTTYGYWPCFTENLSDHSKDTLTTQLKKNWVINS